MDHLQLANHAVVVLVSKSVINLALKLEARTISRISLTKLVIQINRQEQATSEIFNQLLINMVLSTLVSRSQYSDSSISRCKPHSKSLNQIDRVS